MVKTVIDDSGVNRINISATRICINCTIKYYYTILFLSVCIFNPKSAKMYTIKESKNDNFQRNIIRITTETFYSLIYLVK